MYTHTHRATSSVGAPPARTPLPRSRNSWGGEGCSPPGTPHTTPLCACSPLLATGGGTGSFSPPPSCLLKAEPFLVRKHPPPRFPFERRRLPRLGDPGFLAHPGRVTNGGEGGARRSDKQAPVGRPATPGKLAGLSRGGGELRFLRLLHFLPPKLETEPRRAAAERDRPPVGAKSAASSPAAKAAEQGRPQPLHRGRARKPGSRSAEGREKPPLFPAALADLNSVGKRASPPAPPFLPPSRPDDLAQPPPASAPGARPAQGRREGRSRDRGLRLQGAPPTPRAPSRVWPVRVGRQETEGQAEQWQRLRPRRGRAPEAAQRKRLLVLFLVN